METSHEHQAAPSFSTFDEAFRRWRQGPWNTSSPGIQSQSTSYVPTDAARPAARALAGAAGTEGNVVLIFTDYRSTADATVQIMGEVSINITGLNEARKPIIMQSTDTRAQVLAVLNKL